VGVFAVRVLPGGAQHERDRRPGIALFARREHSGVKVRLGSFEPDPRLGDVAEAGRVVISLDIYGAGKGKRVDILVRDVDEADVAAIDKRAAAMGLSRAQFLRQTIEKEARRGEAIVRAEDFRRVAILGADLLDADIMDRAWR
jgi:hypothetical protein